MTAFKAALQNELERMYRKNKIILFLGLDLLLCGLNLLALSLLKLSHIEINSANMATNILSLFCGYVLPIYVVMVTMELFTDQYNDKTILNILSRPVTRFKIYLSKIVAVGIFILLHLTVVLLITLALNFSSHISLVKLVVAYFVSAYPLFVLAMVVGLIAQVVKNGLIGMLFSIILLVLAKALEIFLVVPSAFLFTTYFDWYKMFIMNTPNVSHIVITFMLMTAYGLFTYVLGCWLFDKKEF